MYMLVRLPVACFCILAYASLFFMTRRHLHTQTSRVFSVLIAVTLIHMISAAVTEYTVNNRDLVDPTVNLVWHIIYMISIIASCFLILYYQIIYLEHGTGKRQRAQKAVLSVIALISLAGVLVLPIEYIDTANGSYSYGPKAYALYFVAAYSMIMLIYNSIHFRGVVSLANSNMLLSSALVFMIAVWIQISWPWVLLTDVGITMIMIGMMINTEDSHLFIAYGTGLYNELGCRSILQELLLNNKTFEVGVYVFLGDDHEMETAMMEIQRALPEQDSHVICGTTADNILIVIPLHRIRRKAALPGHMPSPETSVNLSFRFSKIVVQDTQSVDDIFDQVTDLKLSAEEDALQRDELTGLLRRNALVRQVEMLIESRTAFTFVMADLDNFKAVNDTYGHAVGDRCLRYTADVLRRVLRGTDILCRLGGDEFAIVLTGLQDPDRVRDLADRINRGIRNNGILDGGNAELQMSFGARICGKDYPAFTFQQVYVEADEAMYRSKANGKGKIAFISGPVYTTGD